MERCRHVRPRVLREPAGHRNAREAQRVALLCVEDELAICHCKVLLDIALRDRMVDAAVAIEPKSLRRAPAGPTSAATARD